MRIRAPRSIEDALAVRASEPATPMAGGTDLLVHWPERLDRHTGTYLDLWQIDGLRGITWPDGWLEVGALTTYFDLIRDHRVNLEFPLLVDAARQVGAIQIQSRGTWAGNIANGSPAADGVPVLMVYGCEVVVRSARDTRRIPLVSFYADYKKMDLANDELIVGLRIPRTPRRAQRFVKVGSRRAQAIAKVGVAIVHDETGWRVVASSVAPTVRRCPTIERALEDGGVGAPEELLDAVRADVSPIDDLRSTAAYRERVFAQSVYHAWVEMRPR